jgi:two-component system, LuxR family, sensor kinase FixL
MGSLVATTQSHEETKVAESLRREHEFAESLINTAQTIVLVLDTGGRIVRFNPYMEQLSGWRLEEVQGKDWFETFLPEQDRQQIRTLFSRSLAGERTRGNVNQIVIRNGEERDIEWFDAPLTGRQGELLGLLCTGQDITERKLAVEELRQSEERIRAILNAASDAIISIDRHGTIDSINPATEEMFGYAREELIGQNVRMLMPSPYAEEHDAYIARYLQTGEARIIGSGRELTGRHKDGHTFPIDLSLSEIDHLQMFTGIVRNVSERKALQEHLMTIATEEQRRIGQDLHDNVGQQVLALGMMARTLTEMLKEESRAEPHLGLAAKLAEGLKEALAQIRALSKGLVPVEVEAEGLMSSLEELAREISRLPGIFCHFDCDPPVRISDSRKATHLYRIAQEAVANAVKHAQSHEIRIGLKSTEETITLAVRDDGIGIPVIDRCHDGIGLRIMQYRANLIGGHLTVEPLVQHGTLVTCTVPGRVVSSD